LKDPAKRKITLSQLLSNRSGLPDWRPYYEDPSTDLSQIEPERVVQRVLAEPLQAFPGEKEIYSDLGFILLGSILERVSGLSLDRLFQQEISHPLGLQHTGYRSTRGDLSGLHPPEGVVAATEYCKWRNRILVGEVHDENCHVMGGVAGHAGLFSNAADLDRVVDEIFCGFHTSSELFSPSSLKVFLQRQGPPFLGTWALGWDTPSERYSSSGRYYSKNSFGHNGFTGTSLWMDLDRNIAVALLTNRVHPSRENDAIRALRPLVHDAVLEEVIHVRPVG
jgi:CubicO group peptidase (beta-lactamase class C family)